MNNTTISFSRNGWQALGMAIVKQAVDDWRTAHRNLRRTYCDSRAESEMIRECERYLCSPYPEFFADVNGKYIMRKLREEVKNDRVC